jgi:hypothetical protein
MFCPSCGAETSDELRFCRACGMALEPVKGFIADHRLGIESGQSDPAAIQSPLVWEKRVERTGKAIVGASMVGFCLLMLSLVPLGMAHLKGTDSIVLWTVEVLAVLLFSGVGLMNLPRMVRAIPGMGRAQTRSMVRAEPTKELATAPIQGSIPSVTETTTRSLDTGDKR